MPMPATVQKMISARNETSLMRSRGEAGGMTAPCALIGGSLVHLPVPPHEADGDHVHEQRHEEERRADREDRLVADRASWHVPLGGAGDEGRHRGMRLA